MDMLKIEFKLLVYANPEFDYKPSFANLQRHADLPFYALVEFIT